MVAALALLSGCFGGEEEGSSSSTGSSTASGSSGGETGGTGTGSTGGSSGATGSSSGGTTAAFPFRVRPVPLGAEPSIAAWAQARGPGVQTGRKSIVPSTSYSAPAEFDLPNNTYRADATLGTAAALATEQFNKRTGVATFTLHVEGRLIAPDSGSEARSGSQRIEINADSSPFSLDVRCWKALPDAGEGDLTFFLVDGDDGGLPCPDGTVSAGGPLGPPSRLDSSPVDGGGHRVNLGFELHSFGARNGDARVELRATARP